MMVHLFGSHSLLYKGYRGGWEDNFPTFAGGRIVFG